MTEQSGAGPWFVDEPSRLLSEPPADWEHLLPQIKQFKISIAPAQALTTPVCAPKLKLRRYRRAEMPAYEIYSRPADHEQAQAVWYRPGRWVTACGRFGLFRHMGYWVIERGPNCDRAAIRMLRDWELQYRKGQSGPSPCVEWITYPTRRQAVEALATAIAASGLDRS